ncbi:MAG: DUF308 domain-containing protein [Betaproteobacteria bacterium]|nr:DUF308 domain-containing protein [Betaproteobacteria bacterium]
MSMRAANDAKPLSSEVAALAQAHWGRFLVQGALMIALGVLAAALPVFTTLAVEILIGWLLIIGGVWRVVALARSSRMPGFGWSLAMSIVAIALGAMLVAMPLAGMLTLTMLLVTYLVLEAVAKMLFALDLRRHSHGWRWAFATGILDLVLAVFIFAGWPSTAAWAIGLLVAINMIFFGIALVAIALAARGPQA